MVFVTAETSKLPSSSTAGTRSLPTIIPDGQKIFRKILENDKFLYGVMKASCIFVGVL